MDINDLRTIITCVSFLLFGGIVYWAYSSRNKDRFDEAANIPFTDPVLNDSTPVDINGSKIQKGED